VLPLLKAVDAMAVSQTAPPAAVPMNSELVNSPPAPETLFSNYGLRESLLVPIAWSLVVALREAPIAASALDPLEGPSYPSIRGEGTATLPTSVSQEKAAMPGRPLPLLSGLVTHLPAVDLLALEQGMKQFLRTLTRPPIEHPTGIELSPWLIAVVAAATAGEVARRQVRSMRKGPTGEDRNLPVEPPDSCFAR
jgi:hypothetical protein